MDTQQPRVILAVSHEDAVFPSNMGRGRGNVHVHRFNIQHSLLSPFSRAVRSSAVCPSVFTERRKPFPMISVDDRRPETLSFFIGNDLSSKKRPIISRCGFSPFSFSNCLDNFVEKKKKSIVRCSKDEPMIHGGTLIYRTRE